MYNAHYQTADGIVNNHELLFRGVFVIKKKLFIFVYVMFFFSNLKTKKSCDFFKSNFIALPCFKTTNIFGCKRPILCTV